jgi:hypothetical protein
MAFRADPPEVITSSTTTTAAPAVKFPSISRWVPCCLGSFRTVNASMTGPAAKLAAAMA